MKTILAIVTLSFALNVHAEGDGYRATMQDALRQSDGISLHGGGFLSPDSCGATGRYIDGILTCGITSSGALGGSGDCASDGYYIDLWDFQVVAGQSYTVTFSGSRPSTPAVLLVMREAGSEVVQVAQRSGTGVLSATFTAPTSGLYTVGIGYAQLFTTGNYTLQLVCGSSQPPPPTGNCTPTATTACVLGNRFAVQVRYRSQFDNNSVNALAFVKPVIGFSDPSYETAFFYFNSANNIEVMVKMLDQGNRDAANRPTIAVLYGTATPLRIEVTITDTRFNGATRTWTSPFGAQAGSTDFTAFVK